MILLTVGVAFMLLGVFAGAVLVLAPVGVLAFTPGASMWVIFPCFSVFGYMLVAMGGRTAQVRRLSQASSVLMLLLALAAAVVLVLDAASVLSVTEGTLAIWFVLVVAGVIGAFGAAGSRSTPIDGTPQLSGQSGNGQLRG